MEDKIFLKTKYDGLWEKNPHLAFGVYLVIYLILFFSSIFLFIFNDVPGFLLAIWLILLTVGVIVLSLYLNEVRNMSKSTGFVKKNGILYLIKLGYAQGIEGNVIYAPSGSGVQAATLDNNIETAMQVQIAEQEVRNRIINPQTYINVVNEKLSKGDEKYLPKGTIEFITLSNSAIEKENKNFIWISYDKNVGRKIKKVRNAYEGLIEEIKNGN